jgi:hypothetical protein
MTSRVQTLRSAVPLVRPTGRQPGELYVNYPDNQLGVINVSAAPIDLIAIRFFSPLTSYNIGDFVVYSGDIWHALAPSPPGPFITANWATVTGTGGTGGGGGVGIPDAPFDGRLYGRQSGVWLAVPTDYLLLTGGTLSGPLILAADPTLPLGAVTKQYVDANSSTGGPFLPLAGGTLTGPLALNADPTTNLQAATKQYVDAHSGTGGGAGYLPLTGGTLTGPLTLAADPTVPLGTATKEYVDNSITAAIAGISGGVASNTNYVVNGDMILDQRNNPASITVTGGLYYPADFWTSANLQLRAGTLQRVTITLPTDPFFVASNLSNYLMFTPTQLTSILSSDYTYFQVALPLNSMAAALAGTPNAKPLTLSFWVRCATLTGTFSGSLVFIGAGARSYPFTYTIPTANLWTKITIPIPGDTNSQVWSLNHMSVYFDMGCGSLFRTTANAWVNGEFFGVTGSATPCTTPSRSFSVGGVKLEIGNVATPFIPSNPSAVLAAAQKYYQSYSNLSVSGAVMGIGSSGYVMNNSFTFPEMAGVPTITVSQGSIANTNAGIASIVSGSITPNSFQAQASTNVATPPGTCVSNFNAVLSVLT